MKDNLCNYLLPFQGYAKLFLREIHPDRHHGYPKIQMINSSVTSIVNELFKFQASTTVKTLHNLNFFIFKSKFKTKSKLEVEIDSESHQELFHKLVFNCPFDVNSGKSALELFKLANVPVDFSVLDSLPDTIKKFEAQKQSENDSHLDENNENKIIRNKIVQSCMKIRNEELDFDIREVRNFIRTRPYIQFDGLLTENNLSISIISKLIIYLQHNLRRIESKYGNRIPIIIISPKYLIPEYTNGIVFIPFLSTFRGKFYFKYLEICK